MTNSSHAPVTYGLTKITAEEKVRRARAVRSAIASARLDGHPLGKYTLELYDLYVNGDITKEELSERFPEAAIKNLRLHKIELDLKYPD